MLQVQDHTGAAATGGLDRRAGEAGGAEVLEAQDGIGGLEDFEAGLEQQLLHEGVADLHHAAMRGLRVVDRGEGCAVDPIAAGVGADQDELVAGAAGGGAGELLVLDQADTHGVHERVATVGGGDLDFAADGGDAHAVPVPADAADDAVGQVASAAVVQRAEAQAVAQDAADAGGGALEGFDSAGMVVALDLHDDGETVADVHGTGVLLAGADEDVGALAGKSAQERAGVLIAAVLAPHAADDSELDRVGRAVQKVGGQVVLVAGEGDFAEDFVAGRFVRRGERGA